MAARKQRREPAPQVVVAWAWGANEQGDIDLNLLSFGGGTARVYERDKLDPRCGTGIPYFADLGSACAYLAQHKGPAYPVQIDVRAAARVCSGLELGARAS